MADRHDAAFTSPEPTSQPRPLDPCSDPTARRWLDLRRARTGARPSVRREGSTVLGRPRQGPPYLDGSPGSTSSNMSGTARREIGEAMAHRPGRARLMSPSPPTPAFAAVKLGTVPLAPAERRGTSNRFFLLLRRPSEAIESAMKIAKQVQAIRGFPQSAYKDHRPAPAAITARPSAPMSIHSSRNEKFFPSARFMYAVSFGRGRPQR